MRLKFTQSHFHSTFHFFITTTNLFSFVPSSTSSAINKQHHASLDACFLLLLISFAQRNSSAGIVTVEIGIEKKAFHIHKDLLTYYSDYFRGAFNGSFVEATKGKISLVDERVDVFDVVNQFVYTRQLSDGADSAMGWELLIRVWIFGDKYLMPCLQNKAMNALIQKNREAKFIPTLQLKIIYDNTLPGSPLRKFVLNLVTYKVSDMDASMQKNNKDNRWPYEALVDLVKALGAKKKENVGV
ncbi:hypothetical protein KCU93_g339, partial [Aureobasidium melanogenum]